MQNKTIRYITIGKLGATYGVKGWLKIHSYTESPADILNYSPWYLMQQKGNHSPVQVEDGKAHGDGVIVKLQGIETPESARLHTGKIITVMRDQLAKLKKDEFYWTDLEGLNVINKNGMALGKVAYLIATGSNDVLVVKQDTKEYLIPYFLHQTVLKIDLEQQMICVDWEE